MEKYGIHWFRRDLRLKGNPALTKNRAAHGGRVLGLFSFDATFLSRSDFSVNRFQFFLETLSSLKEDMKTQGGDLLVLSLGPLDAFATLLEHLTQRKLSLPAMVSFNRDYEPFARTRDARVIDLLNHHQVATPTEKDHLVLEPSELKKASDPKSPFKVYTPFKNEWMKQACSPHILKEISAQSGTNPEPFSMTWKELFPGPLPFADALSEYKEKNKPRVSCPIPAAGDRAVSQALMQFKKNLSSYAKLRDIPSVSGTSHFSIFLKNGSLTTAKVISQLELFSNRTLGAQKFLQELVWREFFYHVLFHFPHVETRAFHPHYNALKFENREEFFKAWTTGQTGFPIVDAGMRQLNETGWMHNRVRMIVASFLVKDLLIDWRWGERYFMEKLIDGDLAPNNGGWQWSASTGCDAQPYFRVFNPVLQSQRFDPQGEYIKRWVPELAKLSPKDIHSPPKEFRGPYPAPIVEHDVQRQKAIALFKKVSLAVRPPETQS